MRLVADPLQEEQRRALARQRDRVVTVAHEEQLLLLGNADRDRRPSPSCSSAAYAADSALPAVDQ